ncbi:hypothetical protein ABB05_11720 [Lederbergia galactosidilytica]|uniref:AAA+ ATPase domain-containing protein n=2 Tax=Lederbergia galactosidilytica TaxID=217031 RepID=A0A177ZSL5_9BACI|nr:hypothetical protein ABB05_11720 [Lederbergia galactosidilytica]
MQAIEEQMQQLIGLQEVKDSLEELKIYIDNRMKRAEKGNQSEIVSVHFLFKGNPGTGKTTIARMVANYLKAVGYLTEGQLIEVDRSNLVGEYVGHTATKTMNKIKAAMGGVLFIDEAYSLARGEEEDFGREAIDTIVKAMEDYKGKFVVIFAGYPKEIDELLEVNPGLLSRITQTFYFSDYSSEELVDIANGIAHSQGYMIDSEALDRLPEYFNQYQIKGKTDAGNGRLARQVVENAIKRQAVRVSNQSTSDEKLDLLRIEDFGLEKEKVFDLETNLAGIIGLDHVKDIVRTLHRQELINQKRRELNPKFKSEQALNYIFTGNPGTGKTTIARVVAELFKNINVLKKGHLVEVARPDLVGGYLGKTALKTEKVFMRALGGVLFIDEAYALSQDQYGEEAVNTLIKLMEDHQGDICVILAGYEQQMNELLQVNPGIRSRFTNIIDFPDYGVDELYRIAEKLIDSKGFDLADEAKHVLENYITNHCQRVDGNGRYIRNMVEEIIRIQSNRLYEQTEFNEEGLLKIITEDIEAFINQKNINKSS